jgi:phage tail-like protein
MPANLTTPFLSYCFIVDIPGIAIASFSEATISEMTINTVTYREGTDPQYIRELPTLTSYSNPVFRKGLTASMDLYNWHQLVATQGASAKGASKNVSVTLIDASGSPLANWDLMGAFPVRYVSGGMNAASADVVVEEIELAIHYMKRTK